jgi:hypothetical protein
MAHGKPRDPPDRDEMPTAGRTDEPARSLNGGVELLTEGLPFAGVKKVAFRFHYVGDKRWMT